MTCFELLFCWCPFVTLGVTPLGQRPCGVKWHIPSPAYLKGHTLVASALSSLSVSSDESGVGKWLSQNNPRIRSLSMRWGGWNCPSLASSWFSCLFLLFYCSGQKVWLFQISSFKLPSLSISVSSAVFPAALHGDSQNLTAQPCNWWVFLSLWYVKGKALVRKMCCR